VNIYYKSDLTNNDEYMSEARSKAVFFHDAPEITKLKGCALFWETIVVYEGFIQDLEQSPELSEFIYDLIKNNIMKIVSLSPEEFKSGLHDKIYAGLDEDLLKYLYGNADSVTIVPELPSDIEEIVRNSSDMDYQDKELKKLYDSIVYHRIIRQWLDGALESEYFPLVTPEIRSDMMSQMMSIAKMQYQRTYYSRPETSRYNFEHQNRMLLEQLYVSSALCVESDWVPLFRRKLGDFDVKDAEIYLNGLQVVVPFANKSSIQDFSLTEIYRLRTNSKWNNAMNRLAALCYEVKAESDVDRFREEMTKKIIEEYQVALEEERMTKKKLARNLGKNTLYTGISLIPVVGSAVSAVTGIADPVLEYIGKEKEQKNLPFFLNDMRKMLQDCP
jgi:hypothetical protein